MMAAPCQADPVVNARASMDRVIPHGMRMVEKPSTAGANAACERARPRTNLAHAAGGWTLSRLNGPTPSWASPNAITKAPAASCIHARTVGESCTAPPASPSSAPSRLCEASLPARNAPTGVTSSARPVRAARNPSQARRCKGFGGCTVRAVHCPAFAPPALAACFLPTGARPPVADCRAAGRPPNACRRAAGLPPLVRAAGRSRWRVTRPVSRPPCTAAQDTPPANRPVSRTAPRFTRTPCPLWSDADLAGANGGPEPVEEFAPPAADQRDADGDERDPTGLGDVSAVAAEPPRPAQ